MKSLRKLYSEAKYALGFFLAYHKGEKQNTTLDEYVKYVEEITKYDFERDHQTVEVCAKCWGFHDDEVNGDIFKWRNTEPMNPYDGIYHLAKIAGETKSHPNCTHHTPCEAVCGEKFTQFVDSGD